MKFLYIIYLILGEGFFRGIKVDVLYSIVLSYLGMVSG